MPEDKKNLKTLYKQFKKTKAYDVLLYPPIDFIQRKFNEYSNENCKSGLFVYLAIYDFTCDPDDLFPIFAVKPDDVTRIGDLMKYPKGKREESNYVRYNSKIFGDLELDNHIAHLNEVIGDINRISKVTDKWHAHLQCVVDFRRDDNSPTLSMSEGSIKILANWKCSIDVDYYLWGKVRGNNYGQKWINNQNLNRNNNGSK